MVFFGADIFTNIHVALSLVGIVAGVLVTLGMMANSALPGLSAIFLLTTIATSATGFGFPFGALLPSHIVGIISLVALAIALLARYVGGLSGAWRWIYIVTAVLSVYLNVFVLVAQTFLKVPAARALAPTQSEPPFLIAQAAVLVLFLLFGWISLARFHPRG
jgi:hypothetical protein